MKRPPSWTEEDSRIARLFDQTLGPITVVEVIEHKEEMPVNDTDQAKLDDGFGTDYNQVPPVEGVGYLPSAKPNPHNHRYTISISGRDPMVVVRGESADEVSNALQELEASPVYALLASAEQAIASYGPQPTAPQPVAAPVQQQWQQPAPAGPPFGPNVSVPQAPGYQGPPAPQAPAAPQGGRQGTDAPPPGWYRITVPWASKDAFKAYREQNTQAFSGKIKWQSGGNYFIAPDVAQYFQQYGPVPA